WKELTFFFEALVSELREWQGSDAAAAKFDLNKLTKQAANFALQDFSALLNGAKINPEESKITPENAAELIIMTVGDAISSTAAKTVIKEMFEKGGEPDSIVTDLGLAQVSDEGAIEDAINKVIAENEKAVADFRAGQEKSFGFLVGQAMKELKGKGNPGMVNDLLRKKLA